jgi:hypothetical protein
LVQRGQLPDPVSKFPVSSKDFLLLQVGICSTSLAKTEAYRQQGCLIRSEPLRIPCIFQWSKEFTGRDWFADDCFHRQYFLSFQLIG